MNTSKIKVYNLDVSRPKVLLLGNGIIYDSSISWSDLIKSVRRDGVNISQYEETTSDGKYIKFNIPNTILTLVTSDVSDQVRHDKYVKALKKDSYLENKDLKRMLEVSFDAILTTNYTYEIEAALNPRYPKLNSTSKRKYAVTTTETDPKFLLHTYNRLVSNGPDVWHIHGELRRPSSMILSHDEYARYISQILTYNTKRGNDYEKDKRELRFESWIDYFILGDVYILGLGMDYADFDLWWLLGRRLRENVGAGKIVFYEPRSSDNVIKQLALHDCHVRVENCGVDMDNGGTYPEFYAIAIKDIQKEVNKTKE